jgi:hypothetical protein
MFPEKKSAGENVSEKTAKRVFQNVILFITYSI